MSLMCIDVKCSDYRRLKRLWRACVFLACTCFPSGSAVSGEAVIEEEEEEILEVVEEADEMVQVQVEVGEGRYGDGDGGRGGGCVCGNGDEPSFT